MPLSEYLSRLPPMERDILRLHMDLRKSQTAVAKILGVSQPTVNYRYKRARARLEFMEKLPKVTSDEIREVLRRLGAREQDIEMPICYQVYRIVHEGASPREAVGALMRRDLKSEN